MPEVIANGTGRRLMHTRTVECKGYLRDDDLWEVEARLVDTKPYTQPADHYRYDPNRLLPRSAMVRQVRIERLPLRPCMGDVAELLERIETLVGA